MENSQRAPQISVFICLFHTVLTCLFLFFGSRCKVVHPNVRSKNKVDADIVEYDDNAAVVYPTIHWTAYKNHWLQNWITALWVCVTSWMSDCLLKLHFAARDESVLSFLQNVINNLWWQPTIADSGGKKDTCRYLFFFFFFFSPQHFLWVLTVAVIEQ